MVESQRNPKFSVPKDASRASEPRGWTPEEVSRYIQYQLSELSGTNAHHEFEQLCINLARKRIYPNILPSTGPVSAGGDQGSDFETYRVGSRQDSPFFARASEGKVVFACSIEQNYKKKIKEDLVSISSAQPSVTKVIFLSSRNIAKGIRYKLQEYAKSTNNTELEIFDSLAISGLLADPEIFWIATRFLSIPSEVFIATRAPKSDWYQAALDFEPEEGMLTADDFLTIKAAARYAMTHHARHSDLPVFVKKLRIFRNSTFPGISRRSFYEEFVVSLRGLEFVKDCSSALNQYFIAAATLYETSEIEDAAVLINYVIGAHQRGLLDVPLKEILEWREQLLLRLETLLKEDISPGRRSSLLDVKGLVLLMEFVKKAATGKDVNIKALFLESGAAAVGTWRRMLKHVRQSPMFPLETFAQRLAVLAPEYAEVDGFLRLSGEADRLLAARAGKQKLGEQAFKRAKAYYKANRLLDAIDQLHLAHTESFTRETVLQTVHMPLFLAKLYSEANLYAAAKYYALASSFAALRIREDELLQYAYRGLAEAAASDHANGASLNVFLAMRVTILVAHQFSTAGAEEVKEFEWARLNFYAFVLAYGSSLISSSLSGYLLDHLLPSVGLRDLYDEALPVTEEFFKSISSYSDLAALATRDGVAPPFADVPASRALAWEQLGVKWKVEWRSDYDTTATVEGFVAMLQIVLADLRRVELSLLRTEVVINIALHSGELQIEDVRSNARVERNVKLPAKQMTPELVLGVALTILKMVSAYPHEEFKNIIDERMRRGLMQKINPHASYEALFKEFYLEADYDELHKQSMGSLNAVPDFIIPTPAALEGLSGIHKDYDPTKSRKAIENRYRNALKGLKLSLARLLKHSAFRSTVNELRSEGWKDWHILLALFGVRLNFVLDQILGKSANVEDRLKLTKELMDREELASDPQPPVELFTSDKLRLSLRMSKLSTLRTLGFHCWQETPNLDAIDQFLSRFNYWTDDVPHPDPFEFDKESPLAV